jgi:hypothetical protein
MSETYVNARGEFSMIDPATGEYYFIPKDKLAEASSRGLQPEPAADWTKRQLEKQHGGRNFESFLVGFNDAITLGGYSALVRWMFPSYGQRNDEIVEANPNWAATGEIAGQVGSLATPLSPLGAASRVAGAAGKAAASALRFGSSAPARALSKVAQVTTTGGLEGAAMAAGSALAEGGRQGDDIKQLAERTIKDSVTGGLLGAGIGVAGAAAWAPFAAAGRKLGAEFVPKIAGAKARKEAAEKALQDAIQSVEQGELQMARRAENRLNQDIDHNSARLYYAGRVQATATAKPIAKAPSVEAVPQAFVPPPPQVPPQATPVTARPRPALQATVIDDPVATANLRAPGAATEVTPFAQADTLPDLATRIERARADTIQAARVMDPTAKMPALGATAAQTLPGVGPPLPLAQTSMNTRAGLGTPQTALQAIERGSFQASAPQAALPSQVIGPGGTQKVVTPLQAEIGAAGGVPLGERVAKAQQLLADLKAGNKNWRDVAREHTFVGGMLKDSPKLPDVWSDKQFVGLRNNLKTATEDYLRARTQMASMLNARSGAFGMVASLAARGMGAVAGHMVGGSVGALAGGGYVGGHILRASRRKIWQMVRDAAQPKTGAFAKQRQAQFEEILKNMRRAHGGAKGGRQASNLKIAEWASDIASDLYRSAEGKSTGASVLRAANALYRNAPRATAIYALADADVQSIAEDVHELDAGDLHPISTIADIAQMQAEQTAALMDKQMQGVEYLKAASPIKPGAEGPLSKTKVLKYKNILATQVDPEHVFGLMAEGRIERDHVEAMRALYPDQYQELTALADDILGLERQGVITLTRARKNVMKMIVSGKAVSRHTGRIQQIITSPQQEGAQIKARNVRIDLANKTKSRAQALEERGQ